MLRFNETDNTYQVIESIHGFNNTKNKVVEYKKDLSEKRVNSDPWIETNKNDIDWFHKHYYKHFPIGACISLHCCECGEELSYGNDGYGTSYGTCSECIENYEE